MSEHAENKAFLPPNTVEVLVVGGGHAGIEAAWSLSRLGIRVGLVTFDASGLARMSCNPSIGGLGKGQLAREIDALGGLMGRLIDHAGIHYRLLNRRKGPAVRAPRAQADRDVYTAEALRRLVGEENLIILEAEVTEIQWEEAISPDAGTRREADGASVDVLDRSDDSARSAGRVEHESGHRSGHQATHVSGHESGHEAGHESGQESGHQPGSQPGDRPGDRPGSGPGHQLQQGRSRRRVHGVVLAPVDWSGVTPGGAHSSGEIPSGSLGLDSLTQTPRKKGPYAGLPPVLRLQRVATIGSRAIVLTVGTFLRGKLHTGDLVRAGGRRGEPPAGQLSSCLRGMGLQLGRLKTGTPPRLARESIDFARVEEQPGDEPPPRFSYFEDAQVRNRVLCHVTRTTEQTHEILRAALDRSPLYSGRIEGIGPRYCPSIEDKIVRFPDRTSHHVFLEPEGLESNLIYPNGISTSMPEDVQHAYVRSIPGLEEARIVHPGYAVEYDFLLTSQIDATLAVRGFEGLYAAGQINGTSGYEEAATQGIVAGLNAFCWLTGRPSLILRRDQAYIGVLIDDLVTKLPTEPYRMFTSQSEYRLRLRQDNADQRLSRIGHELGLLRDPDWRMCQERWNRIDRERGRLERRRLTAGDLAASGSDGSASCADSATYSTEDPASEAEKAASVAKDPASEAEKAVSVAKDPASEAEKAVSGANSPVGDSGDAVISLEDVVIASCESGDVVFDREDVGKTLAELLKRPEVDFDALESIGYVSALGETDRTALMAEIKYAGYILKQEREIRRTRAIESQRIPDWVADDPPEALSQEARERLKEHRPGTIGQASRIPGVSPSDVFVLAVYIRSRSRSCAGGDA